MSFVFKTQYSHDTQPTEATGSTRPGFYPAKIVAADEKYSKSGRQMIQLSIEVDAGGPRYVEVKEYLLLEQKSAWKIEQYIAAIGIEFGQGQDISIDCNTFIGGKFYLLTCNEPGQKNPDRLFMKPMKAFRRADIPHEGPLTDAELDDWCLNSDGTRKGSKEDMRANALQPARAPQQGAWGAQPQQGGWGTPQPTAQPAAPIDENLEDDDIPF